MNETQFKQVEMHKDFFDRCKEAIDNRFYLEAIFLEYAAIESRLESILGIIGASCNKNLDNAQRTLIKISNRIICLKKARKNLPIFEKSKLEISFFDKSSKLVRWIDKRNRFIHGLYKSEIEYKTRMLGIKDLAEDGLAICRALYNEASRLRRLRKSKPELFSNNDLLCELCFKS